jgi:hypothetical protein
MGESPSSTARRLSNATTQLSLTTERQLLRAVTSL